LALFLKHRQPDADLLRVEISVLVIVSGLALAAVLIYLIANYEEIDAEREWPNY